MRKTISCAALAAALVAMPAMAQVDLGVGGQAGAGVNAGGAVDAVTAPVGGAVDSVDRTVNRAIPKGLTDGLEAATSADVTSGVEVRDASGARVGTVQSLEGDTAVVVQGNRHMQVPVASLYRKGKGLVTSLTRAELRAGAHVEGGVEGGAEAQPKN